MLTTEGHTLCVYIYIYIYSIISLGGSEALGTQETLRRCMCWSKTLHLCARSHLGAQEPPWRSQEAPGRSQEAPVRSQETPGRSQDAPWALPRGAWSLPRGARALPRGSQEAPGRSQEAPGPKMRLGAPTKRLGAPKRRLGAPASVCVRGRCSKSLFKSAVRESCLGATVLRVLIALLRFTPYMYMYGFTLVYIYI